MHIDASDIYPSALVFYTRHRVIYIQTCVYMYIQLRNKLWTTIGFLRCCNLIWDQANNNSCLYFLQFLTISDHRWQFTFVLYEKKNENSLLYCTPIYSWTIEQIDTDIVLLLKVTQIWVITICVVLDHNTVIFQKEKVVGVHIKITGMQDSHSQGSQK